MEELKAMRKDTSKLQKEMQEKPNRSKEEGSMRPMNYTEVECHEWTTEVVPSCEEEENEYMQNKNNPADSLAMWHIEESGWISLLNLEPQLQDEIISSFRPRDASKSVDALLCSFINVRKAKYL